MAEETQTINEQETAATAIQEDDLAHAHAADFSDTTVIFGREITIHGGIYTVVFGGLAILTLIEVLLFELPRGFFTIPLMIGIGTAKAVLVVMYYMHLKEDSRIFAAILLLAVIMFLIATLYLIAVPVTGY